MTITDQTFSLLVHAGAKVGKTTLGASTPAPRLILDAEGGTKFLPLRRTYWDPIQNAPPVADGSWDTCIVIVRDYETIVRVYQWLITGQHPFVSVTIDSITEVQRRCKLNIKGLDQLAIQDWGQLLTHMEKLIRDYRDLCQHPTNPLRAVVFIAETRETNNKWRPYVQGQLAVSLPYLPDVVGYLFTQPAIGTDGAAVFDEQGRALILRRLLVTPHAQFEAGERVQGRLGDVVDNPNVEHMLAAIYPQQ